MRTTVEQPATKRRSNLHGQKLTCRPGYFAVRSRLLAIIFAFSRCF
jgi:hypothetical protein